MRISSKKIAIVSPDVMGPRTCGGVGSACLSLAEALVRAGASPTLVHVDVQQKASSTYQIWQKWYLERGIRLVLVPAPALPIDAPVAARRSYSLYQYLLQQAFDIVDLQDMQGLGYYPLLAKRLGLAFQDTVFSVTLNGPHLWHREFNRQPITQIEDIVYDFLERKSVELADTVYAPSQFIVDWAKGRGWKFPRDTRIELYVVPSSAAARKRAPRSSRKELVFFGRLEIRKGLDIFCEALELLSQDARERISEVTFLGWHGIVEDGSSFGYLERRSKDWDFRWKCIPTYDQTQAVEYLRRRDALAVIPSRSETMGFTAMECMSARIPFIASRIPGFEELIAKRDQKRVLFTNNAHALAERIESVLQNPGQLARPVNFARDPARAERARVQWHASARSRHISAKGALPKISVCITHRNRAQYLRECLNAIKSQTHKPFEVILVDDASDDPAALALLRELKGEFRLLEWKLLINKTRSGPSRARNRAAGVARGDFLLFIDDDDVPNHNELDVFARSAKTSNADILTCAFDRFSGARVTSAKITSRWVPLGDSLGLGFFFNSFGGMHALVRRSCFQRLGGLREAPDSSHEDAEFFARAILHGYRLTSIPDALFRNRKHQGNLTEQLARYPSTRMRIAPYREVLPHPDLHPFLELVSGLTTRPEAKGQFVEISLPPDRKIKSPLDQSRSFPNRLYSNSRSVKLKGSELTLPRLAFPSLGRVLVEIEYVAFDEGATRIQCGPRTSAPQSIAIGNHRAQLIVESPGGRHSITILFEGPISRLVVRKVGVYLEQPS